MKFEKVERLSNKQFRRLIGVKIRVFDKMVEVIQDAYNKKRANAKSNAGRPPTLSIQDRVLMTLEYWREYRTYFSIGLNYGLSESNAFENIRWVENALSKSKVFALPGKKALLKGDREIVLMDVTESPIERPKKNNGIFIQEKRSATQ